MSHARPIHPGVTYLITRRIERRHCLLRPDIRMTRFILYAFIVSAQRHQILLHGFCAMSTHVHYVVTDLEGNLPRFLEMFHRLVAKGIKALRKWDGAVWDRAQTSMVELCTRQALVEKIAYTLANPVSAGLVWRAHQWPGAKTLANDIGDAVVRATRPREYFSPKNRKWQSAVELEVSPPPSIATSEVAAFRKDVMAEVDKLEAAAHRVIPRHLVLGARRAMQIPPEQRITTDELHFQRNPVFAVGSGNTEAVRNAKESLRNFRSGYKKAREAWRAGDRAVEFPAGTYGMRVFHGANVAAPNSRPVPFRLSNTPRSSAQEPKSTTKLDTPHIGLVITKFIQTNTRRTLKARAVFGPVLNSIRFDTYQDTLSDDT